MAIFDQPNPIVHEKRSLYV